MPNSTAFFGLKDFNLLRSLSTELIIFQRIIITAASFIAGTAISISAALSLMKGKKADLLTITKD
ncbi:hypothetical protein A45J_0484 [hot springs metagenome]|uniref:Uncharacterized protein n=1 Tax=hot springs metagenome TaxID=433727 RepID=A0A5J4L3E5_9ZZZZ